MSRQASITWLHPGEDFPPVESAWGPRDPVAGLLAAGGDLSVPTLLKAYDQGIFPWFGNDQPILWWSPDPRMVLRVCDFRLHPSLRKTLRAGLTSGRLQVRIDSAFEQVIRACAHTPRPGQDGTWIVPAMVQAYTALHQAGQAHSVETWWDGELVGGLYCVNLGCMVFGESMFSHRTDASKIALAGLVAFCRASQIEAIDCQQNTAHLSSLGAREQARHDFLTLVRHGTARAAPEWKFDPIYWNALLKPTHAT
ncbi:MAG TPA: leucyl/phenylalanyl-tRNA--protein transferase [Macromonas sp.]|nr:leucyl/phenylalanyl-tRNA--protein transferase [Macromonas sp.]